MKILRRIANLGIVAILALNFGLYNEYQSKVAPGIDHSDLRVFGGLSFDF